MPGVTPLIKKKALSIAIQYTHSDEYTKGREGFPPPKLESSHKDPETLKKILKFFDYKEEDIVVLKDDGNHTVPTKENILKAIDDLVLGAEPGDHFVFHYSGHGGQLQNKDHDDYEEDGMDEVFYPVDVVCDEDFERALDNYILDDDLKRLLVDRLPEGTRLTAIIDCCHSGTSLDLPYTLNGASEKLRPLWSPVRSPTDVPERPMIERLLELRDQMHRDEENIADAAEDAMESILHHSRQQHARPKYVTSWAACIDRDIEIEGTSGGMLTQAIHKLLSKKTTRTHRELITAIGDELVKTTLPAKKYFELQHWDKPPFPKPVLSSIREIDEIIDTPFLL